MKNRLLLILLMTLSQNLYAMVSNTYVCKSDDGKIKLQYSAKIGKWAEAVVPHNIYLQLENNKKVLKLSSTTGSVTLSPSQNPNQAKIFSSGSIIKSHVFGIEKSIGIYRFSTEQKIQQSDVELNFAGKITIQSKKLDILYVGKPMICEMWL